MIIVANFIFAFNPLGANTSNGNVCDYSLLLLFAVEQQTRKEEKRNRTEGALTSPSVAAKLCVNINKLWESDKPLLFVVFTLHTNAATRAANQDREK